MLLLATWDKKIHTSLNRRWKNSFENVCLLMSVRLPDVSDTPAPRIDLTDSAGAPKGLANFNWVSYNQSSFSFLSRCFTEDSKSVLLWVLLFLWNINPRKVYIHPFYYLLYVTFFPRTICFAYICSMIIHLYVIYNNESIICKKLNKIQTYKKIGMNQILFAH